MFNFDLILLVDIYRNMFVFTVMIISFSVYLFRLDYIENDKYTSRFHLILLRFIASIIFLILSPNIISALVG